MVCEIVKLEDEFGRAAERALSAGYDAIALHGGRGYLFTQFVSPLSNLGRTSMAAMYMRSAIASLPSLSRFCPGQDAFA